eukprot:750639-Hanusia_phi.AAC.1
MIVYAGLVVSLLFPFVRQSDPEIYLRMSSFNAREGSLMAKVSEMQERESQLSVALEAESAKVAKYQKSLEESQKLLSDKERSMLSLKDRIKGLETDLHVSQQECDDLKSKHMRAAAVLNNVAKDQTCSVDETVKNLVEDLQRKNNLVFALEQDKARLHEENKSLEEGKIVLLETNRNFSNRVEELQREMTSLNSLILGLKESLKREREEKDQRIQELSRDLRENRESTELVQSQNLEHVSTIRSLQQKVSSASDEIGDLREKLSQVRSTLEAVRLSKAKSE